ncbi:OmpH family outer membrane protein [Rickettsiales endosymbiont of Peranema trichophorum]|uniref:OmpH family outer membrane protein n=1 Tax=Rickettsiales endosymbiont of Peranema trichophorum TaxID=2486577 RepID=UPI001022C047|nr:OmpH family outer membrane protein [Rickettsiales endosymbiont of Peranema trichophorum]RZI45636.1 OmpH family outer membrane protein [Rickettsiales endosymbiont of Peranema trichophorum]
MYNLKKALVLFCCLYAAQVQAATKEIAIVDIQKLMQQAKVIQDISNQINKKVDVLRGKSTVKEKEFKKRSTDLEGQKKLLSQEAFEEKYSKLVKDAEEFNKVSYSERVAIDKASAEAYGAVEGKVSEIVKKIAARDAVQIVLYREQTAFASQELDITSEVLQELDAVMPALPVDFNKKDNTAGK